MVFMRLFGACDNNRVVLLACWWLDTTFFSLHDSLLSSSYTFFLLCIIVSTDVFDSRVGGLYGMYGQWMMVVSGALFVRHCVFAT